MGRTDAAQSPPGSPRGTAPGWDEQRKPAGRKAGGKLGAAAPDDADRFPCRRAGQAAGVRRRGAEHLLAKAGFCEMMAACAGGEERERLNYRYRYRYGTTFIADRAPQSFSKTRPALLRKDAEPVPPGARRQYNAARVGRWTMRNTSRQLLGLLASIRTTYYRRGGVRPG